jgi:hypothetical protein
VPRSIPWAKSRAIPPFAQKSRQFFEWIPFLLVLTTGGKIMLQLKSVPDRCDADGRAYAGRYR